MGHPGVFGWLRRTGNGNSRSLRDDKQKNRQRQQQKQSQVPSTTLRTGSSTAAAKATPSLRMTILVRVPERTGKDKSCTASFCGSPTIGRSGGIRMGTLEFVVLDPCLRSETLRQAQGRLWGTRFCGWWRRTEPLFDLFGWGGGGGEFG